MTSWVTGGGVPTALAILDVISEGLEALDQGLAPWPLMRPGLGAVFGAETVLVVELGGPDACCPVHAADGLRSVQSGSAALCSADRDVRFCVPLNLHRTAGEPWQDRISPGRYTCAIAGIPLTPTSPRPVQLALTREKSWTEAEMDVLTLLQRPLSVLYIHTRRVLGPDSVTNAPHCPPAGVLTEREHEVLVMLADGLPAATMGSRLAVSPRTIHAHLSRIYRKLDVHDRLTAVNRARALSLLADPPPASPVD